MHNEMKIELKKRSFVELTSRDGLVQQTQALVISLVEVNMVLDQVLGDAHLARSQSEVKRKVVLIVRFVQLYLQLERRNTTWSTHVQVAAIFRLADVRLRWSRSR